MAHKNRWLTDIKHATDEQLLTKIPDPDATARAYEGKKMVESVHALDVDQAMHVTRAEIDAAVVIFLRKNARAGYVKAYELIRRESPETLGWCDLEDLTAILLALPEQPDEHSASDRDNELLAGMLAAFKL